MTGRAIRQKSATRGLWSNAQIDCWCVLQLKMFLLLFLHTNKLYLSNRGSSHKLQGCVKSFHFAHTLKVGAVERSWSEGRARQRQADLWGAVFCCVVVNYGLACATLPAAIFTFHLQLNPTKHKLYVDANPLILALPRCRLLCQF